MRTEPSESVSGLRGLEEALPAVLNRLRGLERRVAALEAAASRVVQPASQEAPAAALLEPPALDGPSTSETLGLVGRTSLVLAGAFLIRTFAGTGPLPRLAGVALGLVYGMAWALAADRAGARGRRLSSSFHAFTALAIAYPLVGEAATRFAALPPMGAAAALLAVTGALFTVAWRQSLVGIAWAAALAALGTSFALMFATSAITTFCALFLVFAGASLWLADRTGWGSFRWPAALAADTAILCMAILAVSPGGSPELARNLAGPGVLILALALVGVYLGSFIVRALVRPRSVRRFEVVQTLAVLAAGFGGAIRVSQAAGADIRPLGLAALALGLACYGAAFSFVRSQAESSSDFRFLSSLALLLVLAGSPGLLPAGWLALHFALLGLAAAALGRHYRRRSLQVHGAVLLAAGALASGLLAAAWHAFVTPAGPVPGGFPAPALLVLAALAAGHVLLAGGRGPGPAPWGTRLPGLVLGALGLAGLCALGVAAVLPPGTPAPGTLAAVRTGALALAAVAAGALGRWFPSGDLGRLVYPLLGASALKLLLEDVPRGHPLTLSLALSFFGIALLVAPRLVKAGRTSPAPGD